MIRTQLALKRLAGGAGMEFGKLVQKLLALAWLRAGAERVTERAIQGTDLEVDLGGRRLALEVKTTSAARVQLGKKDLDGLAARVREGAEVYLAVLGDRLLDRWILARHHPGEWPGPGVLPLAGFRAWRDRGLEELVVPVFDEVVAEHAAGALAGGQAGLDEILRATRGYHLA